MKIAVCDDEKEIRSMIKRNVRLLYPEAELTEFVNADELLSEYEDADRGLSDIAHMDILFLDIQMNGVGGIEAARRLRKAGSDVTIIFVTALEEYVFQAFDVQAFHYLIKPIKQAKFFEVLRAAVKERKKVNAAKQEEKPAIAVKRGGVTQRVYLYEIIYLEVLNRKVTLHTTTRENITFYGKLSQLEQSLGEDFVRCHRAYIVNLRYVLRYDAGSVTLDDGTDILLAKNKYAEFVSRYLQWIQKMNAQRREIR